MQFDAIVFTGVYQKERAIVTYRRRNQTELWTVTARCGDRHFSFKINQNLRPCPTHTKMLLDHLVKGKELRAGMVLKSKADSKSLGRPNLRVHKPRGIA